MSEAIIKTLSKENEMETATLLPPVEELEFYKVRSNLLSLSPAQRNEKRANDRTTQLIQRYSTLKEEIVTARQTTMGCVEAYESKNGEVKLRVLNRPGWDSLQAMIKSNTEKVTALEDAMRRLDALDAGFHCDIADTVSFARDAPVDNNRLISHATADFIRRYPEIPVEKVKDHPEYQSLIRVFVESIEQSKKRLQELEPKLAEMNSILESAGC